MLKIKKLLKATLDILKGKSDGRLWASLNESQKKEILEAWHESEN